MANRTRKGDHQVSPIAELRRAFAEALRPPENLTVSQWADRYRVLTTRGSAEPGEYRTGRTPYVRAIQDALSNTSTATRVTWQKGSQIGGTEVLLNWIGSAIDQDPCAMMVVSPSLELAKRLSRQRLGPMIEASPKLASKIAPARERDSANSTFSKEFDGGFLLLCGANSAASLRQAPIRNLALDEVDAYPNDVEGEGSPVELAIARTRTHPRRKIFMNSSPTDETTSLIAREFEKGDQSYFLVPCPDCNKRQRLVWSNVKWEKNDSGRALPETARYVCDGCGTLIPEHKKTWMLEHGEWVATKPERSAEHRSFQLSALYSPVGWFSWADAVKLWDDAQGNREELKTFVNTVLGEVWREAGDAPQWERLYNRRESYPIRCVPDGALVLTAGVDVQGDRLEYEVVGWGAHLESWSVDRGVIAGEPADQDTWRNLERALLRPFLAVDNPQRQFMVRLVCVDAQYESNNVYQWARAKGADLVIPVHGRDGLPMVIGPPSRVDVQPSGSTARFGLKSWPVGVTVVKRQLYGWLRLEQPTDPTVSGYPPGWCHFPMYDEEFFKQLCAERAVPQRNARGFVQWVWEKTRPRNEALDCRVYARAAASLLGLDRYEPDDWKELEALVLGGHAPSTTPASDNEASELERQYWGGLR